MKVVQVSIEPHDNADALEIANIKGYRCIVRKGQFETGDLAVYIPEQSIVPEWLLRRLGLWDDTKGKGKLAGSNGDRVKAIKLRGVLSEGLLYELEYLYDSKIDRPYWGMTLPDGSIRMVDLGSEVSADLFITKWEPRIPTQLAGEVANLSGFTLKYDIENIKNHPEVVDFLIKNRVEVEITEKIHGTFACFGLFPREIHPEIFCNGTVVITSKGLSAKGLAFKDVEKNSGNLYVRKFYNLFGTKNILHDIGQLLEVYPDPIFFLGEIFGLGVQDLDYGITVGQHSNDGTAFRLFDVYQGYPGHGRYLTPEELDEFNNGEIFPEIPRVPRLYKGPLTREVIEEYTDGMDSISGSHVREGIVIKPYTKSYISEERNRMILKSVSEAYLLRKNGTEYN